MDRFGEREHWAEMAEELAGLGYWRMDARTETLRWSKHMFRIFGFEPGLKPLLAEAMARVPPDDGRRPTLNSLPL